MQCYAEAPNSGVERPRRWLVGFRRVALEPGASTPASIRVPLQEVAVWDETRDQFVVEATRYDFVVAAHAGHPGQSVSVDIGERLLA